MNATETVFQSKWGFHPCSREVSRKLRFLNGVYQKALHRAAAWGRWDRKATHNRVIRRRLRDQQGNVIGYGDPQPWNEPAICPVFSEVVTDRVTWHPRLGYFRDGVDYTHVVTNGHRIMEAARQARTPVAREDVRPLPISEEEIDRLYQEAVAWVESL